MPDISNWTTGVFKPHNRSIGGIIAEVTIQESGHDDLTVTEHPVERGAPISDHAFKRPATVSIRAGWSATKAGNLSGDENSNGMYSLLLSWQMAMEPFDLFTGKRAYREMLIASIVVDTDSHSEFALMATITCQQVIRVNVQTEQSSVSSSPEAHSDPPKTSPRQDTGNKPPTPFAQSDRHEGSGVGAVPENPTATPPNATQSGDSGNTNRPVISDPGGRILDLGGGSTSPSMVESMVLTHFNQVAA